jgi:MFS family permease
MVLIADRFDNQAVAAIYFGFVADLTRCGKAGKSAGIRRRKRTSAASRDNVVNLPDNKYGVRKLWLAGIVAVNVLPVLIAVVHSPTVLFRDPGLFVFSFMFMLMPNWPLLVMLVVIERAPDDQIDNVRRGVLGVVFGFAAINLFLGIIFADSLTQGTNWIGEGAVLVPLSLLSPIVAIMAYFAATQKWR